MKPEKNHSTKPRCLAERGMKAAGGTMVDTTFIHAPEFDEERRQVS